MTDTNDTEETETERDGVREFLKENLDVSRRDVMKVAGAAGLLSAGAGSATSHDADQPKGSTCADDEDLDTDCDFRHKFEESCLDTAIDCGVTFDLDSSQDELCKGITYSNGQQCVDIRQDLIEFEEADTIAHKAANDCVVQSIGDGEEQETQCVGGDTVLRFCPDTKHDISHVEFFDCLQPAVTSLEVDCSELTINTEEAGCGDITVDFRLQLVEDNDDGSVTVLDDSVLEATGRTVSDPECNGTYIIDVKNATDEPWNRVAFDRIEHSDGTDMLAEGDITDSTRRTPGLCEPPTGTVTAECSTLTISELTGLEGGDVTFDYTLQLVDSDGTVKSDVASATGVSKTVDSDGKVTVSLGSVSEPWNKAVVSNLTFNGNSLSLDPSEDMTPSLCNPPTGAVTAECSTLTISELTGLEGGDVTFDYTLQLVDSDGMVDSDVASATGVSKTVDANGEVTVDVSGVSDPWNKAVVSNLTFNGDGIPLSPSSDTTPSLCNPPTGAVTAECSTLTISDLTGLEGGDVTFDYTLQLVDSDGMVDSDVASATGVSKTVDSDGKVTVSVGSVSEPWNKAVVSNLTFNGNSLSLDPSEDMTPSLCNPPTGVVTAECSTLTISELTGLEDGDVTFDYTLQLVDSDGMVDSDVASATGVSRQVDANGEVTVDVSSVSDPWNKAVVSNLTFNGNSLSLDPSEDMTPLLCNPPTGVVTAECSTLTISELTGLEDGDVTFDYELQLIDTDGNFVETVASATGVSRQVDANGEVTVDVSGVSEPWNKAVVSNLTFNGDDIPLDPSSDRTSSLCNPPLINDLAFDCGTIFIDTNDSGDGDPLSVDFNLELGTEEDDGSLTTSGVTTESDVGSTYDSSNDVHTVDIIATVGTSTLYNLVEVTEVIHDPSGYKMLANSDVDARGLVVVNNSI